MDSICRICFSFHHFSHFSNNCTIICFRLFLNEMWLMCYICVTYVSPMCYLCVTYVLHMYYLCFTYVLLMCSSKFPSSWPLQLSDQPKLPNSLCKKKHWWVRLIVRLNVCESSTVRLLIFCTVIIHYVVMFSDYWFRSSLDLMYNRWNVTAWIVAQPSEYIVQK